MAFSFELGLAISSEHYGVILVGPKQNTHKAIIDRETFENKRTYQARTINAANTVNTSDKMLGVGSLRPDMLNDFTRSE